MLEKMKVEKFRTGNKAQRQIYISDALGSKITRRMWWTLSCEAAGEETRTGIRLLSDDLVAESAIRLKRGHFLAEASNPQKRSSKVVEIYLQK